MINAVTNSKRINEREGKMSDSVYRSYNLRMRERLCYPAAKKKTL